MAVFTGLIKTVDGNVQKTIVVPKIDRIAEAFDGKVLVLLMSYFLFKNKL